MDRHEVISLPPRLRKPPRQKLIKGLQFLQPPILTRPHFAQVSTQFYEPRIPLGFRPPLPGQNLVDLSQNEQSPFAIELGQHGRILSTQARQANQGLLLLGAARAPLLSDLAVPDTVRCRDSWCRGSGGSDATVGEKLGRFDPSDRVLNQVAELRALLVTDRGPEVLNLDQPFADKHHLSDVCDTGGPGRADQLRIESQQSGRLFRITAGCSLPFEQAASTVELSDGIHVGHEVVLPSRTLANRALFPHTKVG